MVRMSCCASFIVVAILLTTIALPLVRISSGSSGAAELEWIPLGNIHISGNGDFTAENGVVSGTGSSDDPYIIEGWEIVMNGTGTGITVVATDAYFVIRDVHIVGGMLGIRFDEVYHARVTASHIDDCLTGLTAFYTEVSKVDNNVISNCSVGVSLRYCDAFKVTDNTFLDNEQDMLVVSLPWIQTRQADLVFAVIAIPLAAFVALLIYMRFRSSKPPEETP